MIIGLGKLEELPTDEQKILLGKRIEELLKGEQRLELEPKDEKVEELAQHFLKEIIKKHSYDTKRKGTDWQTIDINSVKNKDVKEIGAEWLCKQAFDQLNIGEFLQRRGWNEEQISLAGTHMVSRAVYPASELKTVSYIKENSPICKLTGYNTDKLTKDKLYGISKALYEVKDDLENFLSKKTNELQWHTCIWVCLPTGLFPPFVIN